MDHHRAVVTSLAGAELARATAEHDGDVTKLVHVLQPSARVPSLLGPAILKLRLEVMHGGAAGRL